MELRPGAVADVHRHGARTSGAPALMARASSSVRFGRFRMSRKLFPDEKLAMLIFDTMTVSEPELPDERLELVAEAADQRRHADDRRDADDDAEDGEERPQLVGADRAHRHREDLGRAGRRESPCGDVPTLGAAPRSGRGSPREWPDRDRRTGRRWRSCEMPSTTDQGSMRGRQRAERRDEQRRARSRASVPTTPPTSDSVVDSVSTW